MPILSLDDYISSTKQRVIYNRTTSRTSTNNTPWEVMDLAGQPGAGTLAGTSTTTGVVPTSATAGFPSLTAFTGTKGYLTGLEVWAPVAMDVAIYDVLWKAGAYAFNAATSGNTPTSYSGRVPGGTDFRGLELWMEAVTAFTGNPTVQVTYNNETGTTGRSTGAVALGLAPTLGRMTQLPLQSGDSGIQGVTGVTATVATVGTFNLLVMRPLARVRIPAANFLQKLNLIDLGCPEVFATSALMPVIIPDSTSTSNPWVAMEISNK